MSGIEDAHHHFFAERRRHVGDAQLDFAAGCRTRLDATILRPALFGHVHAREDLDARGDRGHHG
jgi:hypothetical protein